MWWIDILLHFIDFRDIVKCSAAAFLIVVFVSLMNVQKNLRRRDILRWQLKTKRDIEKEINEHNIDLDSADEVITYPPYGIEPSNDVGTSYAIFDQRKWSARKSARIGWEVETFFQVGVLLLYLATILIRLIGFVSYYFLTWMDNSQPEVVQQLFLFIILRPLLFAIAFLYLRIRKRGSHMEQYPRRYH